MYIFALFRRISFKLGKLLYFKATFTVVSVDDGCSLIALNKKLKKSGRAYWTTVKKKKVLLCTLTTVAASGINLTSSMYTSNGSRLVVASMPSEFSVLSTHNSSGSVCIGVLTAAVLLLTGLDTTEWWESGTEGDGLGITPSCSDNEGSCVGLKWN